ncbi:LytTR family transcriptional regulator DNA-binding domain-containing protein [Pedobacter sp. Hv1]|uniref:LytTR family transcriptional regulator DNA-binding domain-containing protein n=1 Tax=Pedobacter sp. Hv1 TaxID=1740090 RepID=UPI001F3F06D7|nr:LytTR family transcriptional regulator DNA-binding domain-containing protein [Pedobacter sp. Hv1]
MKGSIGHKVNRHVRYPGYLWRWLFAMFTANLIVINKGSCFCVAIYTAEFYGIEFLFDTCIVFILIHIVVNVTAYLDSQYPWHKNNQKRIQKQILLGVCMPILLVVPLQLFYVLLHERDVDKSFFNTYLYQITFSLLVVNIYLFYCWSKEDKKKEDTPKLTIKPIKNFDFELYKDIACIYIEEKNYFSLSFKGEKMGWNNTLSESMLFLPSVDFYPIKRSFIVNRLAILEMRIINAKKTKILLKPPIDMEIEISQRENAGFKKWFAKK